MSITSTELQQQYIAYFGRPGDPEGINYWTSDATDIKTAADFAEKIYAQPEYQTTTIASKTTAEQVNQLYVNLFNRSADAPGLLYWTTEIEKGSLTLSNLAYDLIYAASNPLADNEGQAAIDAANLNAKVAAAEAYTAVIASNSNALMAYQPGAAYESAVSFISSVSFNTQVNQPVITTTGGLAPLSEQAITVFVGQMVSAQAAAEASTAASEAAAANAEAAAEAAASQLVVAQLQAAQASLANETRIAAEAAAAAEAAEAAANSPQSLILATTLDNVTGGSSDDIFNGAAGTLDSDILNGGDGNDTLKVTLTNADDNNATFQSSNIENLSFRVSAGNVALDLGDVTDVATITGERLAGNLTLNDVLSIPTDITIDRNTAGGNLTVAFNGNTIIGAEDSLNLNVTNSSGATVVNVDEIETVNLVSTDDPAGVTRNVITVENASAAVATETLNISGAGDLTVTATDALTVNNSSEATVTLNPTAATTITHSGSGSLTVAQGVAAQTVTASGTGALTYTAGTGISSVTGSSGDDRFVFAGNLLTTDTVAGGEGTDTLSILGDTGVTAALTLVSGIETLEVNTEAAADTIDLSLFTDAISTVNAVLDTNNTTLTLNDTQAGTYGVSTETTGATAITLNGLVVDLLDATGTSDSITVNLNNTQDDTVNALTVNAITANDIETITFNADSASDTSTSVSDNVTVVALAADDITTLNISGDADFAITGALGAAANPVDTVNASSATDAVDLLFSGSNITYTGGSGVDTLSFGTSLTSADTIDGGDGSDVVNATFNAGTVTPADFTSVETFNATFTGGALNASNLNSLTTINIDSATAATVISGIPATTTTIEQSQTTGNPAVNIRYATGADATVAWTNGEVTDNTAIGNGATTFANIANLTVSSENGNATNSPVSFGSITGDAALTSLTINTSSDGGDEAGFAPANIGDGLQTGNITGANLETLTIQVDEAGVIVGTLATAPELKTLSISNLDAASSGNITTGTIGNVGAADELTSINITTSGDAASAEAGGGSVLNIGAITATRATTGDAISEFTVNLAGEYGASQIGAVTGSADISSISITTDTVGTSLTMGAITPTFGSITGDVTINAGTDFTGTNSATGWIQTEASGTVGNVSLTSGGTMAISTGVNDEFIGAATSVGNLSFNTLAAADSIDVGEIEQATTLGNIDVTGSGSVTFDGAPAATSIGNVSVAVASGETVTLNGGNGSLGAATGVMGSTTVTGAGSFNMTVGPVTALGNVDLGGLTGSTSSSNITLNDQTLVGVVYTGSDGIDILRATGGSDVITPGLGGDIVITGGGQDVIDFTESTAAADEILSTPAGIVLGNATGSGSIDQITGFTPGAQGDRISFSIAAWNTAGIAFENMARATPTADNAGDLLTFAAAATTLGAAAQDGDILFAQAAGLDAIGDLTITMTSDAGDYANGDGMPIVWHDEDGGFAEVGVLAQAGGPAATLVAGTDQYTPLLRLTMTKAVYDTLTGDNFSWIA